jgi:hypothetical protein
MTKQQLNGSVHEKKRINEQINKKKNFDRKIEFMANQDEQDQLVARLNMSKQQYREYKSFLKSNFKPQGLGVEHTVTWKAGDRLINTVTDGISRLTGSGSNSSIPSGNPSLDVGRNAISLSHTDTTNTYDNGDPDSSGSSFLRRMLSSGTFLQIPETSDKGFMNSFLEILGNREMLAVVGSINLIAFSMYRRKINLVLGMACLTTLLVQELSKKEINHTDLSEMMLHHQRMSVWLDDVSSEEMEDPEVVMEEVPVPQGFGNISKFLIEAVIAFISLGLGIKAKSPFFHTISNMMKVPNNTKESMATSLLNISNKFSEFFSTTCKNETLARYFEVDMITDEDVRLLLDRVQDHIAECNAGTSLCQGFRENVYAALHEDINRTLRRLDKKEFDYRILSSALMEVNKLHILQKSFNKSLNGDRIEPVGILIYGKPGTLKTVLQERIQRLVSRYTIPEAWKKAFAEDPTQFFYVLPNDQFHDGYNYKAWFVTKDDLFQKREAVGSEEPDSIKVIQIVNTAPYVLKMSKTEDKNRMYMRSPFFMGTTNLANFGLLEAVVDTDAVERRFNIRLDVTINSKYTNKQGKLDFKKVPMMELITEENAHINSTYIPEDFWDITLIEHVAGRKLKPVSISFDDVIRKIISSHKDKIKNFYINKETTNRTFANLVDRLDQEFLKPMETVPRWNMAIGSMPVPQSLGKDYGEMEIRSTSDGNGGRVYVPLRTNYVDNYSNIRREVSPDDSISHIPDMYIPDVNVRHCFGPHDHGDEVLEIGSMPGSFRGQHVFDRNNRNPIMDYVFNRHPDMYEGFKSMYLAFCHRNNYTILFDNHLVCLNMHLTCISKESLEYVLDGLNTGYFLDRLKLSLQKCDEDGLDYFTLEPKYWTFIVQGKKILKKIAKYGTEVFSFIKKHFVSIMFFGGMIGAAGFFLWKLYRKIIGSAEFEPQSVDHSKMAAKGYARRVGKATKLSSFVKTEYIAQGSIIDTFDTQKLPKLTPMNFGNRNGQTDIMTKIANKYFFIAYIFYRRKETGETCYQRLGHMVNLAGNVFQHPFHYVFNTIDFMKDPSKDSFQMVMITTTKSICYRFPMKDFLDNFYTSDIAADSDKCLFVCKHAQNTSAGILKYLVNKEDVKTLYRLSRIKVTMLGTYNSLTDKVLAIRMKDMTAKLQSDPVVIQANWTGQLNDYYSLDDALEYEADLSSGDCGSLIFSRDGNFQNRMVLGMHVAGDKKIGFSTMMTYEDSMDMMIDCDLKVLAFHEEEEPDFIDYNNNIVPQSTLQSIGTIHKDEAPGAVFSSDIIKSRFYGKLPDPFNVITHIPAKLAPFTNSLGELIDPGAISLLNYKKSPGCIPYEYITKAAENYESLIRNCSISYPHERNVIDIKEALHHFRDVKPIASSTSPGHPMVLPKYVNLKKKYFKAIEKNRLEEAEDYFQQIAMEVERVIVLYKKFTRPFFMYVDNNKDETRKREKALKGLTRMFSGCPFIMLIVFRMYFGSFMDMYFGANVNIGSAIGVNPYSMEWDKLARRLQQFGQQQCKWLVGAGDFSCFDGHQQVCILQPILGIIVNWYGGNYTSEDNRIRYFMWSEITNSRHAFRGLFYEWYSSLPSGNPMTAIINTMYNNMVFRIAFQFARCDIDTFNEDVYMVALGDDVLFSVSQGLREVFNELTMPEFMSRCGMVYTNELKENAVLPFRELEEVEFLKRSFVKHRGLNRWIAPLRMESIINMLVWTKRDKKNVSADQTAVDNVGVALREITLHGREAFEYWFDVLNKLWQSQYPEVEMKGIISGDYDRMLDRVLDLEHFTF